MHRPIVRIVLLIAALLLCGYFIWAGLTGQTVQQLPQGTQTLTGTLIPAELSLSRRGTHVLKVDGEDIAYVESTTVNLRLFELTDVGVTGVFHVNTDPTDLPVLIASNVHAIDIPAESREIPSLGMTLRVPSDWSMQSFDDGVSFALTGSSTPLLRVMRASITRLPDGTPMFVAGYNAVRINGEDGAQTVHVMAGRSVVTFTWTPDDEAQTAAFAQMLRTAIVRASSSSARTQTGATMSRASSPGGSAGSATSTAPGQPCGGPAGVLCPAGSYCAVTDADGVGTCKAL